MAFEIKHGDCLEVMRGMADNSVDAIVTDPPYGLVGASRGGSSQPGDLATPYGRSGPSKKRGGFMGKEWDASIPGAEYWSEALRIAKPGAYILAFGGTRTFHRLAVAIEDAGWEIRDTLMWVYGSGFPKSRNVCLDMDKMDGHGNRGHRIAVANRHHPDGTLEPNGEHLPAYEPKTDAAKQWAGWGTALKPAWEPIIMARKPMVGTVAENVLAHGTGAINVDACRVPLEEDCRLLKGGTYGGNRGSDKGTSMFGTNTKGLGYEVPSANGRWPANLIHDGSDEVLAAFPDAPGQQRSTGPEFERNAQVYGKFAGVSEHHPRNDSGSAARFFYCAKASKSDRGESNGHPTVKPTELMRYLVRLVTQPGGTVLDPFTGSGSTGKAAVLEGFEFIGIEREAEYVAIAEARIVEAQRSLGLFA
jgi:DNA modification methylase